VNDESFLDLKYVLANAFFVILLFIVCRHMRAFSMYLLSCLLIFISHAWWKFCYHYLKALSLDPTSDKNYSLKWVTVAYIRVDIYTSTPNKYYLLGSWNSIDGKIIMISFNYESYCGHIMWIQAITRAANSLPFSKLCQESKPSKILISE